MKQAAFLALRYAAIIAYLAAFFAALLWIGVYVVPLDYADEPTERVR